MMRVFVVQHLLRHECRLVEELKHESRWRNAEGDKSAGVPRQRELDATTVMSICNNLGIVPLH